MSSKKYNYVKQKIKKKYEVENAIARYDTDFSAGHLKIQLLLHQQEEVCLEPACRVQGVTMH